MEARGSSAARRAQGFAAPLAFSGCTTHSYAPAEKVSNTSGASAQTFLFLQFLIYLTFKRASDVPIGMSNVNVRLGSFSSKDLLSVLALKLHLRTRRHSPTSKNHGSRTKDRMVIRRRFMPKKKKPHRRLLWAYGTRSSLEITKSIGERA